MTNTGGFRGFADFASPNFASASNSTTAAATLAAARSKKSSSLQANHNSSTVSSDSSAKQPASAANRSNLRPSPIYTGSDQRLVVLFRKIGQKRDPTTKVRALEELTSAVFPPLDAVDSTGDEGFPRPEKIAALCHLIYLLESKLGYDNNAQVRGGSYKALTAARAHVPKAWGTLFLGEDASDETEVPVAASTVGIAWGASRGDPAADVARCASEFIKLLIDMDTTISREEKISNKPNKTIQMAVLQYSKTVLGCKRASALQEIIYPVSASSQSVGGNAGANAAGKAKKSKGANQTANVEAATSISEAEKEEMEERYERVMLSVLNGLGWLVECSPEQSTDQYATIQQFPESSDISRLMQSSRGSFRREAYNIVGKLCQFAPSIVVPSSDDSTTTNTLPLASLISNRLSSERDPSNFVSLLEMVLSYFAAFRGNVNNTDPWKEMDAPAFTKSLSKALCRACCGSPANAWGPTILPIVASLPREEGEKCDHPLPLVVVESLVRVQSHAWIPSLAVYI